MNTRLEAHKCGLGTLTREALGTIGSGPNTGGWPNRPAGSRNTCEDTALELNSAAPSGHPSGDGVRMIMVKTRVEFRMTDGISLV